MDKNISYTESEGKTKIDWNVFLDKAIFGLITPEDHAQALTLASDWVTCACGTQYSIIPRWRGRPEDDRLFALGVRFMESIDLGEFGTAKIVLAEIEERSCVIINEIKLNDGK